MPWGARLLGAGALHQTFGAAIKFYTSDATWVVGTNVEYAIYVEFGTSRMAAQPYLRPAIEHAKRNSATWFSSSKSVDAFVARLALEIEREAKRLAPVDTGRLRASIRAERLR